MNSVKELNDLAKSNYVTFRDTNCNVIFTVKLHGSNLFRIKVIQNLNKVKYQKSIWKTKLLRLIQSNDIIVVMNRFKIKR